MLWGCWHLAMALNRLYGLDMLVVENTANTKRVAGERYAHAVTRMPDGRLIDALGVHPDRKTFRRNYNSFLEHRAGAEPLPVVLLTPIDASGICDILDRHRRSQGSFDVVAWQNPEKYPFAGVSEAYARVVFGEAVEDALKAAAPKPAENLVDAALKSSASSL